MDNVINDGKDGGVVALLVKTCSILGVVRSLVDTGFNSTGKVPGMRDAGGNQTVAASNTSR